MKHRALLSLGLLGAMLAACSVGSPPVLKRSLRKQAQTDPNGISSNLADPNKLAGASLDTFVDNTEAVTIAGKVAINEEARAEIRAVPAREDLPVEEIAKPAPEALPYEEVVMNKPSPEVLPNPPPTTVPQPEVLPSPTPTPPVESKPASPPPEASCKDADFLYKDDGEYQDYSGEALHKREDDQGKIIALVSAEASAFEVRFHYLNAADPFSRIVGGKNHRKLAALFKCDDDSVEKEYQARELNACYLNALDEIEGGKGKGNLDLHGGGDGFGLESNYYSRNSNSNSNSNSGSSSGSSRSAPQLSQGNVQRAVKEFREKVGSSRKDIKPYDAWRVKASVLKVVNHKGQKRYEFNNKILFPKQVQDLPDGRPAKIEILALNSAMKIGSKKCARGFKWISPLVLDFSGKDAIPETLHVAGSKVRFDLTGSGTPVQTGWVKPTVSFLAFDANGNGRIDDGGELFGEGTRLASGARARNGFEALARHARPGADAVSARDAIFARLLVWTDSNMNGVSEPSELRPLAETGVTRISLKYVDTGHKPKDALANRIPYQASFFGPAACGTQGCKVYDVFFTRSEAQASR